MTSQRGASMTAMVAVLLPALLVVIGLVVDGGAQAAAVARAERVAAAAARAASDATAQTRLGGGPVITGPAITAAQRLIAAEEGVSGSVEVSGDRVIVHTTCSAPTTMLSLIGITQLRGTGTAAAALTPDR